MSHESAARFTPPDSWQGLLNQAYTRMYVLQGPHLYIPSHRRLYGNVETRLSHPCWGIKIRGSALLAKTLYAQRIRGWDMRLEA